MKHINKDIIEGNWKQLTGSIVSRWGRLTNDDLKQISGNREMLLGRIQELYGLTRSEVETELAEWENDQ
jgi:uncharacterized protein YjbJ (UPF0337 family)